MFDQVIVCLDGSSLAEQIIPLARGLTRATAGKLIFFRVVEDPAEMSAEESYLKDCARHYDAELRFAVSPDPVAAIKTELEREPRAIAALTTHGRTAWTEAIIGSIAFRVLRESMRPVLLFRPHDKDSEAPNKITRVTAALDGSAFSEKIIPYAVRAARSLSAHLLLVQALPVHHSPLYIRHPRVGYPRIILSASTLRRDRSHSWNPSAMGCAAWRTGRCTLPVSKRHARYVAGNDNSCPSRGESSRIG